MTDSPQAPLEAALAPDHLDEFGLGRALKQTISLCPVCLARISADVHERSGEVWMDKACPEHGRFSVRVASDSAHYYRFDERLAGVGSCCGPGRHCGDQVANHSCNLLIEITQRCNLTCPTCYADSSPERDEFLTVPAFTALLDGLLANGKDDADVLQLSGGEPTIHPQLFEMIDIALDRGVRRVYLNTNGVRLAGVQFAARLAEYRDRVSIYLQFDGFRRRTLQVLRGRESLIETKLAALDNCERHNLDTVLVMTLTDGVNDDELGQILERAAALRCVHKLMIQPAMYSGRYHQPRLVRRATVADVAKAIVAQTDGVFAEADFGPIPCSDPNCFSVAIALKTPDGLLPVSRYFPRYETWADTENRDVIAQVTDTFDSAPALERTMSLAMTSQALTTLPEDQLDQLLDEIARWQAGRSDIADDHAGWGGLLAIGIKPFMDAYSYDQDRIDRCCVHIVSRDGTPVSFCEYNAINRPTGQL